MTRPLLPVPTLLWIDTEGYELEVLYGAPKALNNATALCIEVTPYLMNAEILAEMIKVLEAHFDKFLMVDGTNFEHVMDIPKVQNGQQVDILCLKNNPPS